MSRKFLYEFKESAGDGTLSFDTDAAVPQKIEFEVEQNGNVWVSANRAGWLHLAKVCAELGLGDYEPGYHFHKNLKFKSSNLTEQAEVSFGVIE